MERIFLSYHFDEAGKAMADLVQELVATHGLFVVTGERLGGNELMTEIGERIESCDALICILTERDDERATHWVNHERSVAYAKGKKILSILGSNINDSGPFSARERIRFDPADPLPAFLRLSATIGDWRREDGRFVRAVLQPDTIGENAHNSGAQLEYRCWQRDEPGEWKKATPQRTGHRETLAFMSAVPEAAQIEVRLRHNGQMWESGVHEQRVSVKFGDPQ